MGISTKIKYVFFVIAFLVSFWHAEAQYAPIKPLAPLDPPLSSTSGMNGIGDEIPYTSAKDSEGNIYIAGNVDYSQFIMKINTAGVIEWNHRINGNMGGDGIRYMFIGSDNNIHFITSNVRNTADFDPGAGTATEPSAYYDIIKAVYTPSGEYVSHKKLTESTGSPYHYIYKAVHDANDDIYLFGYSYSATAGTHTRDFDPGPETVDIMGKYYIVKYTAEGELAWHHTFASFNSLNDFEIDATGVYFTGQFSNSLDIDGDGASDVSSAGYSDVVLAKYNKDDGSILWAHRFGGSGSDTGMRLHRNTAGNIVVAGYFTGEADFDPSGATATLKTHRVDYYSVYGAVFTSEGSFVSAHRLSDDYDNSGTVFINGISEDAMGNYYVYGYVQLALDFDASKTVTNSSKTFCGFIAQYDSSFGLSYLASIGGGTGYGYIDEVHHVIPLNPGLYVIGNYRQEVDLDPNAGSITLNSIRTNLASNGSLNGYWRELFALKYCELPSNVPVPANAWPTYVQQESENIKLTVKPVTGADGYHWTVPSGFTISGNNTKEITLTADATAESGEFTVHAYNACGSTDAFQFSVTTGANVPATISLDDIELTYGDANFTLSATSTSTGTITYEELDDVNDAITLEGDLVKINGAGTAKVIARITGDATYGEGFKEVTITINKKPLLVRVKDHERKVGEENPEFEVLYGEGIALGNALHFDGVNDEVRIPSNSQLGTINEELTVEAWVNLANPAANQKILGTYQFFILGVSGNKLYPEVWDHTGAVKTFEAGNIAANTWTHLAFSYKANDKMIGYINGVEVASIDVTNPIWSNVGILYLGQVLGWRGAGIIDEVRLWNVARSAEEISSNMGAAINPDTQGLIAYYNFNQGIANGVNTGDNSLIDAKGNNGTLRNFALSGTTSNWVRGHQETTPRSFIPGEDESVLDVKPTASTNASPMSAAGAYDIILTGGMDNNYSYVFENGTLLISETPAEVTLSNLNVTYNGSPRSVTVTTDPADLPVIVTYNGSATVPVNAGTYEVLAYVDHPAYEGAATGTFTIAKASQAITFTSPGTKTIGDAAFNLTATASSNLPVTITASSAEKVQINGKTVTLLAPGEVTFTATQAGNQNYKPATSINHTICIRPAKPSISGVHEDESLTLTSSSDAGNIWYLDGVQLDFTEENLEVTSGGAYQVSVVIDGCESALSDEVVIHDQSISFGDLPVITEGDTDVEIEIITESEFPVTLSVSPSENVEVNGNKITALAAGEITITAHLSGDASYLPATISTTVCIKPATPSIEAIGTESPVLSSSSETGNVWYLDGNVLDFTGQILEVTTSGTFGVTVSKDGCISDMSEEVVIHEQTVSFGELPALTEGDTDVEIEVVTDSELPVTLSVSPSEKATVDGNSISILAAGEITIIASLAGDATHLPVAVSETVCVRPAKPTIEMVDGPQGTTQLKSSSATGNEWMLNGQLIANASGQLHTIEAEGTYTVRVTKDGCSNTSDDFLVVLTGIEQSNSIRHFYPNPATDVVTISTGKKGTKSITFIGAKGELVMQLKSDEESTRVNVSSLPAGIYLVVIQDGQAIYKQKLVKK